MPRFKMFEVTKNSLAPVPARFAASVAASAGRVAAAPLSAARPPPPPVELQAAYIAKEPAAADAAT
jgi:hypothetical protein